MTDYVRQYLGREKYEWEYSQLSIWSMDIETTVPEDENGDTEFPEPIDAKGEILLITLTNLHTGKSFTFGSQPYSGDDTRYMDCGNEKNLLKMFLGFWQQINVDIITGWNIEQFDVPYLVTRITDVLGEDFAKQLSPWGLVRCTNKEFNGRLEYQTELTGISILDYMILYKKYILTKQESYSLANITEVELGHSKLDHSEYKTWKEFHTEGFETKFVPYNVIDALLIKQLDDKLNLIRIVTTVAYKAGINFEDVSSPIKTWDSIIHNTLLDEKVVVPQATRSRVQPLDGAYVKEPVPGRYKNVSSIDATSLYPSIIITNNISPETYVGNVGTTYDDFEKNTTDAIFGDSEYVVTPAGARYSKAKRGILPRLMVEYMVDRKTVKNEMLRLEQEYENTQNESLLNRIAALDAMQMAIKILLNSCYGATANEHFRFYKHDHAASITLTGQYLLRSSELKVDALINEKFGLSNERFVIYCDTDSVTGDSIIEVNGNETTIEEFFDMVDTSIEYTRSGSEVKRTTGYYTDTVDDSMNIVNRRIKYVMRHKTKKKLYRVTVGGAQVTITEDHSLIVLRDGQLVDVSVLNLKSGDKLIRIRK
jgi:DNA polymerase elongation subunit (family B)